jgi:3-oxoacyl-[acyl-carrier-protein] synthase II
VVVTGIGLMCGVGNTTPEVWKNLLAGKSGMAPITGFDTTGFSVTFAAEVKNFDPLNFVDKKESRKMARFIHFALAATQEAMEMSGLKITDTNADRVGVHIGSGIGGFDIIEREHSAMLNGGPRKISPFFIPAAIINLAAGQVSIKYGAKGPNEATATACTTSAHSIGDAYHIIKRGDADAMIAGGAEAAITPMGIGGFAAMRALSTRNDDPEHACRPFDKDRDGFIVGEGAGILILEDLESAKARGAKILAEIIGYGMSADAYHITSMAPEGAGCKRAMQNAIKSADIQPGDIQYVNAHATSTPVGDVLESAAMEQLFGDYATSGKLLISSTKSMTGHLLGGAGGLEAGITIMALLDQIAPPTTNLDNLDPECRLNYVPNKPQNMKVDIALSNSFGFGGTNGSLIFRRWQD